MENLDFLNISLIDLFDIALVALLLFSLYRLVKGTVAINIFLGIVIIYMIWKITDILNMDVLSNILGNFISVGFFALIVVFQQEIRKFLLLIGSSNFTSKKNVLKYFKFFNQPKVQNDTDVKMILDSCTKMSKEKTGAIIILERNNNLDFIKNTGDKSKIFLSSQILETIFFKNSPLHDGAIIIKNNYIQRPDKIKTQGRIACCCEKEWCECAERTQTFAFFSGKEPGKSSVLAKPLLPDIQCLFFLSPMTIVSKKSPGP